MRIGIIGDPEDLACVYFTWVAEREGGTILTLPEAALGVTWAFAADESRHSSGHVDCTAGSFPFDALDGVFVRFNPTPPLPPNLELPVHLAHAFVVERRAGLHQMLRAMPCVVANRPTGGRSNGSKPLQMCLLSQAGFEVPAWIVTNDRDLVLEFANRFPEGTIYKACSGLRARVRRLDDVLLERLGTGTTPIIVQRYIPGRDVRVHTVGTRVFPTEVRTSGIDYRYESERSVYRETAVPTDVADLCCRVAAGEGLAIAGFDFRVTDDGSWFCLEMNPVPSFLPYEMQTGQEIARAILDLFKERLRIVGNDPEFESFAAGLDKSDKGGGVVRDC